MNLSPLKLSPIIKDYIWGGRKLINDFNKQTNLDRAAESWELSTHPDGSSIITEGEFKGKSLPEYIKENGLDVIGENAKAFDFFPILIKLIDAKENLSIQVHPDDRYALQNEGEYGKTEMWYVVDCDEDAYLYYGLNRTITKDEFLRRIADSTILDILNKVPVHKGDVFFIPAGTIHAICGGIVICEIQQNSNTTYRVYDYNRAGADGRPRPLHVNKAADVATLSPSPKYVKPDENTLAECKYFTVKHFACINKLILDTNEKCFQSLIILGGNGSLTLGNTNMKLSKGDSIFIPAQKSCYTLEGNFEFILSYV